MPIYAKLHIWHIWYQQFTEFDYTHQHVNQNSPAGSFAKKKQFYHHHKHHLIFILDLWKNWSILAKNLIFMVLAIRPNRNFMLLSLEFRLTSYVMNLPYGVFHILQNHFFCISWTPHYTPCTLKSGIVVLVGINVLVGKLVRKNKRTGWSKHTGEKIESTF